MNFPERRQSSATGLIELFEDKILLATVKGDHRSVNALLFQCPKERRQELANWVYSREQVAIYIPGSSDPQPLSALQIAVRFSHKRVASTLLDAGADPHLWLADKTCLHVAVINGDAASVRLLLEAGARGDMPAGLFGEGCGGAFPNALMLAAQYGYTDCLRLLIKACTQDIEYRLYNGATALSLACQHGHVEAVQVLIQEGGASVDPGDGLYGESMLDMAVRVHAESEASRRLHLKVVLRKKLNEQRRRRSMEHWQISSSYDALLRDPVQAKAMCNGINHETGEVLEGPMTDSVYAKLMEHMGLGEGPSGRGDVKASTMIIAAEDLEGLTMPTSMSIDKADVLGAMAAAEAAVHVSAAGELAAELAAEAPQDMAEPEGCMTALRRTLGVVADALCDAASAVIGVVTNGVSAAIDACNSAASALVKFWSD